MDFNQNTSPTASPVRKQPRIVEDDKKEQRMELRKKASTLQKYVHFEASIRPHIIKLTKDIDDLVSQLDEIDASVKLMQDNIKKEQEIQKNANFSEEDKSERESKIQEILALEDDIKRLLIEKEKYISRSKRISQENQG
ncbi:hypothetical protein M9Y10_044657 [Tritrichomonas musculus]|uniref:Uncharacterized protein n=1 Tax=Tritrichomonas musculus TaxID=1915356 RepID=A0ABR2JU65_9EUKA